LIKIAEESDNSDSWGSMHINACLRKSNQIFGTRLMITRTTDEAPEDMKTDPSIRTFPLQLSMNSMWNKINLFSNYETNSLEVNDYENT